MMYTSESLESLNTSSEVKKTHSTQLKNTEISESSNTRSDFVLANAISDSLNGGVGGGVGRGGFMGGDEGLFGGWFEKKMKKLQALQEQRRKKLEKAAVDTLSSHANRNIVNRRAASRMGRKILAITMRGPGRILEISCFSKRSLSVYGSIYIGIVIIGLGP